MGRLFSLPDEEEVPGSNPGAPTSHLQGNPSVAPPLGPPFARFLQPKCLVVDGTKRGVMVLDVTCVTLGKLRRRDGLVMSGAPREPG
jgi:hypothetical protein